MKRRPLPLVLAALALLLGGALALLASRYHWVREETREGYQGEALSNDFLAAQRLLQLTGHRAACLPALPRQLPASGDLLILPRRRQSMDAVTAKRLAAWVAGGGLLLAEAAREEAPDAHAPDGLLRVFDVAMAPRPAEAATGPALVRVGASGPDLRLHLPNGFRLFQQAGGAAHDRGRLVDRDWGAGRVFLCTGLACLDNRSIAALDHADFLCAVADLRPAGKAWIVLGDGPTALPGWLKGAWPILAALAALLAMAAWAAAPRFGPLLPDPEPVRRSFLEHLDACGRYQWRGSRGRPVLAAARDGFLKRLERRRPGWSRLEPVQLCANLAAQSGLPPAQVRRALLEPAASAAEFLAAIRTLQHLGKDL